MGKFVKGQLVRVVGNTMKSDYPLGSVHTISLIDESDSTMTLASGGRTGGWISFADVQPVQLGWDYAKSVLPAEVVSLLEGCSGIEAISLKRSVCDAILLSVPNLGERIRNASEQLKR